MTLGIDTQITYLKGDPAFDTKSTRDWRRYQLDLLQADDIDADHALKCFVNNHSDLVYDTTWAHNDLTRFVAQHATVSSEAYHYFFVTDLDFGKLPVAKLIKTLRELYDRSSHGGYFSMQSYYFNWTNDRSYTYPELDDDVDIAVEQWVKTELGIKTFSNQSLRIKQPLQNQDDQGRVIAGVDFMYTHGNIRFWLWKT